MERRSPVRRDTPAPGWDCFLNQVRSSMKESTRRDLWEASSIIGDLRNMRKTAGRGTQPLQPPFLVFHMLAQCASVEEVVRCLEEELTLVDVPMMGTVSPLHWAFHDKSGGNHCGGTG